MERDEGVHFESVEKGLDEDKAGGFELGGSLVRCLQTQSGAHPDSSSLYEKPDPTEEFLTLTCDGDTG